MKQKPDKHYRKLARDMGLDGSPTGGYKPNSPLLKILEPMAKALGTMPWSRLDWHIGAANKPEPQEGRMLGATCETPDCGYTLRIARCWIDSGYGCLCPRHGPMVPRKKGGEPYVPLTTAPTPEPRPSGSPGAAETPPAPPLKDAAD